MNHLDTSGLKFPRIDCMVGRLLPIIVFSIAIPAGAALLLARELDLNCLILLLSVLAMLGGILGRATVLFFQMVFQKLQQYSSDVPVTTAQRIAAYKFVSLGYIIGCTTGAIIGLITCNGIATVAIVVGGG